MLDASDVGRGALREVGFLDVYPADDAPAFNGAWSVYPFFSSGSVIVNGIEQGLFVTHPHVEPRGQQAGLTVSLAEPADPASTDTDWIYVVRVSNHGPGDLDHARLIHMPPADAGLVLVRASQGTCTLGSVATCELGKLAAGSEAFVFATIRVTGERTFVTTAIVTARDRDGETREVSGIATTRGVRYPPQLELIRPSAQTAFRAGRNNTIQWTMRGMDGDVSVELSRDDGATWITLTDRAPNVGFFDWTATGAGAAIARIRVTAINDSSLTRISPAFTIAPQ